MLRRLFCGTLMLLALGTAVAVANNPMMVAQAWATAISDQEDAQAAASGANELPGLWDKYDAYEAMPIPEEWDVDEVNTYCSTLYDTLVLLEDLQDYYDTQYLDDVCDGDAFLADGVTAIGSNNWTLAYSKMLAASGKYEDPAVQPILISNTKANMGSLAMMLGIPPL